MEWLNEREELLIRKTDVYAWAMAFRPEERVDEQIDGSAGPRGSGRGG